ncbi:SCO4848 family membrane protein [Kineococcus gynurae]|uniref:SCO4848 family membrane protein n=1 Tax=Kineococcus gynurae TaxID=452979 RepID=A0ABV5LT67_9ACTN
MVLSRRSSIFLTLFGVWSWFIWPNFLRNIWADERSWADGPTAFFLVHLVLVVVSLVLGTAIAVLGVRGLVASRRRAR